MGKVLASLHHSVPRRKANAAWRMALVARHLTTMVADDEPASFMEWKSLADVFDWANGPAFAAFCHRKLSLARDDSGLPVVNLLAPLAVTITNEVPEISNSSCSLVVD